MLDAHLAHVVVVVQAEAAGEGAALLALGGGLDVLVGDEVIHDHDHPALVEDLRKAGLLKLVDRHGGGDVVAQDQVQPGPDQLARPDLRKAGVVRQDLLRHCHAHTVTLPSAARRQPESC